MISICSVPTWCVTDGDVAEVRKSYYESGIAERE